MSGWIGAFAGLTALCAASAATGQTYYGCSLDMSQMPRGAPKFADYPVGVAKIAKPAPVKLTQPEHRAFRTRIREAGRQPPNFAGHYVVSSWGCGTSCAMSVLVDLATGDVAMPDELASVGETPLDERVQGRPDSRLIVVTGMPGEDSGKPQAVRYYVLEGRRLRLLKT